MPLLAALLFASTLLTGADQLLRGGLHRGSGLPGPAPTTGGPAAGTLTAGSCAALSPADISALLGTRVYAEPVASADGCAFGTAPAVPASTVVLVATGPAALAAPAPMATPIWSVTYPGGAAAPDDSGRSLAAPLRVSLDPQLFHNDSAQG